jgi:hypothetical protein
VITTLWRQEKTVVIDEGVPPEFARQISGLYGALFFYAPQNFLNEKLAPGEDGLPVDCSPILAKIWDVKQIEVLDVADIGHERLSVKCKLRLVLKAKLNELARTTTNVETTWNMSLLVEPRTNSVIGHHRGWDTSWQPNI